MSNSDHLIIAENAAAVLESSCDSSSSSDQSDSHESTVRESTVYLSSRSSSVRRDSRPSSSRSWSPRSLAWWVRPAIPGESTGHLNRYLATTGRPPITLTQTVGPGRRVH